MANPTIKVWGRRPKPDAWPYELYRESDSSRMIEMLVHGIWKRAAVEVKRKTNIKMFDAAMLDSGIARGALHAYPSTWSATDPIDSEVSQRVTERLMSVNFPKERLSDVAAGRWEDVLFDVVSENTFSFGGEYFKWVQTSVLLIDSPTDDSFIWKCPETSMFKAKSAARKCFNSCRDFSYPHLEILIQGIPDRNLADHDWRLQIQRYAQEEIKALAIAEKRAKANAERERKEAAQAAERERHEEQQRKIVAERMAQEKKDREKKRLQEILAKPVQDLSPEEYTQRMQLRRDQGL